MCIDKTVVLVDWQPLVAMLVRTDIIYTWILFILNYLLLENKFCLFIVAQQCSQHSYRLVPSMSSPSFQDIDLGNLSSSNSPSFGRVEVCSNNEWISVCSMGFGDEEAMYICHDLGHSMNGKFMVWI